MNYALAYAVTQRIRVLVAHGKTSEEIMEELSRRFTLLKGETLESVLEKISQAGA